MMDRICSGGEIKAYLNSLVDLVQSTASRAAPTSVASVNCNATQWSQGCEAGWSKTLQVPVTDMTSLYQQTSFIPLRSDLDIQPCCEGFFCPRGLACMIPCPVGARCVQANYSHGLCSPLPVDMPKAEKVLVVERIIDALDLAHIRNLKVGSVEKRGISGGQRKRVNVGLEMVMVPSLLILDEPTSGLDKTSSQLVLRALRREAFAGVNVGVVLHQPSYGLFRMFDDVMLLANGGRTVYLGPMDDVEEYFANMGIIVPERINPPDHFMDVLEGITKPEEDPQFDAKILPIKWIQYKGYDIPEDLQELLPDTNAPLNGLSLKENLPSSQRVGKENTFLEDAWGEFKSFIEVHWDDAMIYLTEGLQDFGHNSKLLFPEEMR